MKTTLSKETTGVVKIATILFSKRLRIIEHVESHNTRDRGTSISWRDHNKYLSVVVDKDMTWRPHTEHANNEAKKDFRLVHPPIPCNKPNINQRQTSTSTFSDPFVIMESGAIVPV